MILSTLSMVNSSTQYLPYYSNLAHQFHIQYSFLKRTGFEPSIKALYKDVSVLIPSFVGSQLLDLLDAKRV